MHALPPLQKKLARETLSRLQHAVFERRAQESTPEAPSFQGWGIAPLRFAGYQVRDLQDYAEAKISLHTHLGGEALRSVADVTEAPPDSPLFDVLKAYLEQLGVERDLDACAITILDGPLANGLPLDEAEEAKIAALLAEAAALSPLARAECARRMARMAT